MIKNKNIVFIAKSLDGYIAGKNGDLEWLHAIPNPENNPMGFTDLMNEVDAIVMGRTTFETVCSFNVDWPYNKPVFVLSNSLKEVPQDYAEKVTVLKGNIEDILEKIHHQGFFKLYIDGGKIIQSFLEKDLIHELRISTIPILLGEGTPLFDRLPKVLEFNHVKTNVFLNQIVQSFYERK